MSSREHRRARRVAVSYPALIESIGQPQVALPPEIASVYERVMPDSVSIGTQLPGVARDLSTNGGFFSCNPFPLLTRVQISFHLPNYGPVEAVGWVLWRRTKACEFLDALGESVPLSAGIGVLFEAVPLEARSRIAAMAGWRGV